MVSSSPLRDAMRGAPQETWLDQFALASLRAADAKFFPRADRALVAVELTGAKAEAYSTAKVSLAVQDATAKIGHLLKDPRTSTAQSRKSYREDAPLIPRGQSGNVIYFGFPEPTEPLAAEPIFDAPVQTLSERAVVALIGMLPEGREDDRALDAVLARHVTERAAINDLVEAVQATAADLGLRFKAGEYEATSTLTHDQAEVLDSALRETQTERKTQVLEGILDGMRTSRRLFYLELESEPDISGALDTDMLEEVKEHIGDRVRATVETTRAVQKSGKLGRPSHRLVRLERPATLL